MLATITVRQPSPRQQLLLTDGDECLVVAAVTTVDALFPVAVETTAVPEAVATAAAPEAAYPTSADPTTSAGMQSAEHQQNSEHQNGTDSWDVA